MQQFDGMKSNPPIGTKPNLLFSHINLLAQGLGLLQLICSHTRKLKLCERFYYTISGLFVNRSITVRRDQIDLRVNKISLSRDQLNGLLRITKSKSSETFLLIHMAKDQLMLWVELLNAR